MSTLKVNELDTKTGTTITVAAGKTLAGTDIIDTAQIAADAITATEIEDGAITNAAVNTTAALAVSKLETGTRGDTLFWNSATKASRLAAGTSGQFLKTQGSGADPVWGSVVEYNDAAVLNDIATLALHSATQNNQTAYNLSNAFVDQYEDDTGIDTETNVDRSASGEYMASVSGTAADSETSLLLHFDGANDGTVFTDSSTYGKTATLVGTPTTSNTYAKFGTTSGRFDAASEGITFVNDATFQMAGEACAWDWWWWSSYTGGADNSPFNYRSNSNGIYFRRDGAGGFDVYWNGSNIVNTGSGFTASTWTHYAITKEANGTVRLFKNGTALDTTNNHPAMTAPDTTFKIGSYGPATNYIDEFRVSKGTARWTANFTPPTAAYDSQVINPTGNYTSTTETALSSVSTMGIVVLYKNQAGTATLDTDLVAEVSSNGGTNYTSAPLTAGGTFSTGINIAKSNDITVSNASTAPKYRISFANQSILKETRVYGVAIMY